MNESKKVGKHQGIEGARPARTWRTWLQARRRRLIERALRRMGVSRTRAAYLAGRW